MQVIMIDASFSIFKIKKKLLQHEILKSLKILGIALKNEEWKVKFS